MAGGMESMSNIPYYLPAAARSGLNFGNVQLIDGMVHDGLWDPYNNCHMVRRPISWLLVGYLTVVVVAVRWFVI